MDYQLTDKALPENLPAWGVLVLESHHSPTFAMNWRTHEFVKIVYVWKGRRIPHWGLNSRISCHDVIIIPPHTRKRIVDTSEAVPYVCCIATELLAFESCLIQSLKVQLEHHRHGFTNRVTSLLRR